MAWRKLRDGKWQTWKEQGDQLEGYWRGTKPGKFGDVGQLEDRAGDITTCALPTALARRLTEERVPEGALIRITYLGYVTGQSGKQFKNFDIEIDDDGEEPGTLFPPGHEIEP